MANAGVRFATDLHRRLVGVLGDAAPSEAHVSRLVRTPPERLNLVTLDALWSTETRALGVNERVAHSASGQVRRRLRHHSCITCPHAEGP